MQLFTHDQLSAAAHSLGGDVRFARDLPGDQPVMSGAQDVQVLDNGLVLYLSHSRDLVDARSDHLLAPGIMAAFLLDGSAELELGRRQQRLDAHPGGQCAMLANLTEADHFRRHWQAGRQDTKVCLSFSHAWLELFASDPAQCGQRLQQFSRTHWQFLPWQPSASTLQRARQLTTSHAGSPLIQRMQREGFALDLAGDILAGIEAGAAPRPPKRLSPHLQHCLERLRGWLDSGEADHLSIARMARELGTNPVDLQNGFRQRHGTTIAAYLRRCRLERAHRALREQRLSVEDAASLAGYEHISSFSAAFRREFGVPPSRINKP